MTVRWWDFIRWIQPDSTEPRRSRTLVARIALLIAPLLVLAVMALWRSRPPRAAADAPGIFAAPATPRVPADTPSSAAASPPTSDRTIAAPATVSSSVPLPSDAIRGVIEANAVPGRILFLDFALDRNGMRLVGASGAAGRGKPAAPRSGFGLVHYEAFDATGRLTAAGSVEDPTRRRIEHPAASNDGRIESTVMFSDEGSLAVRLPGESAPARMVFFRDKNPAAPTPRDREVLGEFRLRFQP